mgnify:CR=1 FL=1
MGSYATTTAISELLPQYLVGNTTTSDTAGMNIFSRHVDRTEGIVNAYISARYDILALTSTTLPPILRAITEDIASFMSLRGTILQNSDLGTERKQAYDRAWKDLEALRDGDIKLAATNGTEVATRTARMLTSTDYSHIFNLDDPQSWKVDDDQVDDIGDTRD